MACPNLHALLDFSLGNIDDNHAMQALRIDNDEDLFLLMAQAHRPMPRLAESNLSRMADDLSAPRK